MPVRTLEIQSVPLGFRPPLTPTTGRGEGQQAIGRAFESIGQSISDIAEVFNRKNEQAKAAMQRATATEDANKTAVEATAALQTLHKDLVSEGREDDWSTEAPAVLQTVQDGGAESHLTKANANEPLYRLETEERLQPIRMNILKIGKDLTVSKSMRVWNEQADAFISLGATEATAEDLRRNMLQLFNRTDLMVAETVIDKDSANEMKEQALVEMMSNRSQYLSDTNGNYAQQIIEMEYKALRAYMKPLDETRLAAARHQGGEKGRKAWADEHERQIIRDIRVGNLPFDVAMQRASESGVDTGKIEGAFSEHSNRVFMNRERVENEDAKKFHKSSRFHRIEFILAAVNDRKVDLLALVNKNKKELTPEDAEALVNVHTAMTKARKEPDVSDSRVLGSIIKAIDADPTDKNVINALNHSREVGLLTRGDFEQWTSRVYERRRVMENKDTEAYHRTYQEEMRHLKDSLRVIPETQDIDPVAQSVSNAWEQRLSGAMWGAELYAGDAVKFKADPRGFANEMKTLARRDLEAKIAAEGIRLLESFPNFLNENGQVIVGIWAEAYKEKRLSLIDAKRLEITERLQRNGQIPEWPFKPTPPPPAPPKTAPKTWGQKFQEFFGAGESKTESTESRTPKREDKFK